MSLKKSGIKSNPHLGPHRNRSKAGSESWWYEDYRGVDLYIHAGPGVVAHARIGWNALLRAAQRSSGREVIVK
jgi:hypothetical protein